MIARAEACIAMSVPETAEDRRMRQAAEIWEIAHDDTIPITTALRIIADRMEKA